MILGVDVGFEKGRIVQSPATTEQHFAKRTDSLEAIFGFVSEFAASHGVSEDVTAEMRRNAKAINIPAEHYVVHAIRQHFSVDDQDRLVLR